MHWILCFMALCFALDLLAVAALVTAYAMQGLRQEKTEREARDIDLWARGLIRDGAEPDF